MELQRLRVVRRRTSEPASIGQVDLAAVPAAGPSQGNIPFGWARGNSWRTTALLALVGVALLATGVSPSSAGHGGPHLTQLGSGTFTDDVGVMVKLKLDGRATNVVNMRDASDVVFAEIFVPVGATFAWHTHPGAVLLTNVGPGTFTYVNANDCVLRTYSQGEAFVDPGQGNVHTGFNDSGQPLTLYAMFLDVTNGVIVTPADAPGNCNPFPGS
jgi:hypothetical protein